MNPDTLKLVLFAEQMAALAAKTIVELRGVIEGSNTKDIPTILDDADATYRKIIDAAKQPPAA